MPVLQFQRLHSSESNQKFCASYDKGSSGIYYLLLEPFLRAKLPIAPFKNCPHFEFCKEAPSNELTRKLDSSPWRRD
jgi:hypothetical protein